jgi:hypothetical protein
MEMTGPFPDANAAHESVALVAMPNSQALEATDPAVVIPAVGLICAAGGAAAGYWLHKRFSSKRATADAAAAEAAAGNEPTERSVSRAGTQLVLRNMLANVNIEPTDEPELSLTVTGRTKHVSKVQFPLADGTLIMDGGRRKMDDMTTPDLLSLMMPRLKRSEVLGNRRLQRLMRRLGVELLDDDDWMEVTARVPAGTNLAISSVGGAVVSRAVLGELRTTPASGCRQEFIRAGDVHLGAGSNSKVAIEEMEGALHAEVGYNSRLSVNSGRIKPLHANVGTYGELRVNALAEEATISCGYDAKAGLAITTGDNLVLQAATYGKIKVADGDVTRVHAAAGYDAQITFSGSARNADINTGTYASVEIDEVRKQLIVAGGYDSKVLIRGGTIAKVKATLSTYAKLHTRAIMQSGDIHTGYDSEVTADSYGDDVRVRNGTYSKVRRNPGRR